MKSVFLISCLMVLSGVSTAVSAEKYYKWVDKNGVTHYSETKPADVPTTLIKVKAGNPMPEKAVVSVAVNSNDNSEKPSVLETPQPTEQQLATQRKNCSKASSKLIALENAGRVRQLDEQSGEYRYLPNQEKLAEISNMRQYLKANCGDR